MRLDDEQESTNFEVQGRGSGGFGGFGGGGGGMLGLLLPLIGSRFGCMGIVVVVGIMLVMGINPLSLLGGGTGVAPTQQSAPANSDPKELTDIQHWSLKVLGSTERTWGKLFQASGQQYQPTILSFYSQSGTSGCGAAQSAMGPFYCPTDKKVYLDTDFFTELKQRFGAPGDFAQAYVIGHEVGHHIQRLLGILNKVQERKRQVGQTEANALQVRVELQADCFAGAWAFHANRKRKILEPGDVDEALTAAAAIGDDTLQGQGGTVRPETFTHGSAAQRQRWFKRGLQTGSLRDCDTFTARDL